MSILSILGCFDNAKITFPKPNTGFNYSPGGQMSASNTPRVTVEEGPTTITVVVPKDQQEAVLAAIKAVTDPVVIVSETELPVPTLSIVPPAAPSPTIVAERMKQTSGPLIPTAPIKEPQRRSSVVSERTSVDLTLIAPSKESRTEFNLPKFIDGDPKRLKQLAGQALKKLSWLIDMLPDTEGFPKADGTTKADEVRKCLEMSSDRTTGNPNHWALVQLAYLQKELHEQEEVKHRALRLQATRNAPKPLERTAKAPANNGWTKARNTLTTEEQAKADAQSEAALAAKKVTIGASNSQAGETPRGVTLQASKNTKKNKRRGTSRSG